MYRLRDLNLRDKPSVAVDWPRAKGLYLLTRLLIFPLPNLSRELFGLSERHRLALQLLALIFHLYDLLLHLLHLLMKNLVLVHKVLDVTLDEFLLRGSV